MCKHRRFEVQLRALIVLRSYCPSTRRKSQSVVWSEHDTRSIRAHLSVEVLACHDVQRPLDEDEKAEVLNSRGRDRLTVARTTAFLNAPACMLTRMQIRQTRVYITIYAFQVRQEECRARLAAY